MNISVSVNISISLQRVCVTYVLGQYSVKMGSGLSHSSWAVFEISGFPGVLTSKMSAGHPNLAFLLQVILFKCVL
jgi:hypothetical protein